MWCGSCRPSPRPLSKWREAAMPRASTRKKPSPVPRARPATADEREHNYPAMVARMERLIEISRTIASTVDQGKLLRQIVEAARELTGSQASSIMLLDPTTDELRFEATTNLRAAQLEGVTVPREGSISGWIVSHNETLLVPDTRTDARWNPRVDEMTPFQAQSIV